MAAEMIERALRAVGTLADEEIDLADAALLLGALDMPNVSLKRYRDHVERLAGDVAALARAGEPLERRRRHLNAVLSTRMATPAMPRPTMRRRMRTCCR